MPTESRSGQTAKTETAEQFAGSIFKFSIATFANMIIYAAVFVITNFFVDPDAFGQATVFIQWTNTFMTLAILGLDQALLRFYKEPPAGASSNSLFRHSFYFSSGIMMLALIIGSTLLSSLLYNGLGFSVGQWVIPLLFLNAFFYLISRYFNLLYRLEMNIKAYTIQSIVLQFVYQLFYLLGAFFKNPNIAMILCSVLGFGLLAAVLIASRRKTLRPNFKNFNPGVYKAILPFGFAVAPTAVFVTLTGAIPSSIITQLMGLDATGVYAFAYKMSNVVTMVQGGFAAFWAPYMYANYKTQRTRIYKVHDLLNFLILAFFCVLVLLEDVMFWVFANYRSSMAIFPLLMFSAVFNILTETTVHGNAIARRPIFDTIGIIAGSCLNFVLCFLLIPRLELYGAALALVIGNAVSYLFRTLTAQKLYRSIESPLKTTLAMLLGITVTVAGTVFHAHFWLKSICCLLALAVYCLMYSAELVRLWNMGLGMLKSIFRRKKAS